MQFQTKELKTVLAKVKAFAATRGALPILKGIRIATGVEPGTVQFEATDLEGFVALVVKADVAGDGEMVVDAKALSQAVATAKGAKVSLGFDGTFDGGSGTTGRLQTMNPDDWPSFPTPDETLCRLDGDLIGLAQAVPRIALSASTDQARPILCGIAVEADEEGNVTLAATDSYRLATYHSDVQVVGGKLPTRYKDPSILWPATLAVKAVKHLTGAGIAVHIGERGSYIASDRMVVYLRHIEGAFPKWRSLMPEKADLKWFWTFDGKAEADKMLTVAKMYDGIPVRIDFTKGTETAIKADQGSYEAKMTGSWTSELDGESPLMLGLHPRYLADCIQVVGGRATKLEAITNLKPVIITGEEGYLALLMPVRV